MAAPTPSGMYVLTQNIPAANVNTVQQTTGPCQTPHFLQRFIKGEPKTLGAIQVAIGLLQIGLGGILCSLQVTNGSIIVFNGVPFWAALFYIISGSLSISAERSGSRGVVKSSLGLNIVSIVIAGVEIIIVPMDLWLDSKWRCRYIYDYDGYYYYACSAHQGIASLLLILTALEFCIAFSTSVFGCKSVCCPGTPVETQPIFPVQNHYTTAQLNPMGQAPGVPVQYMQSPVPTLPAQQGGVKPQGTREPPLPSTTPPSYYEKLPGYCRTI